MAEFLSQYSIAVLFLILALGIPLGRIRILGFSLGISSVLFTALFFGLGGMTISPEFSTLGLCLFIFCVGYTAGFQIKRFWNKELIYFPLYSGLMISCAIVLILMGKTLFHFEKDVLIGVFAGALTSTPGLATAVDVTGSGDVSIGYGFSYPMGVIGVVVVLKGMAYFFGLKDNSTVDGPVSMKNKGSVDEGETFNSVNDVLIISLGCGLGFLLGKLPLIPVSGSYLKLGATGGTLLTGLLFSSLGRKVNFLPLLSSRGMELFKEVGICFFLAVVGCRAGRDLEKFFNKEGLLLLIWSSIVTLFPMLFLILLNRRMKKFNTVELLGLIPGGMTSTPGLACAQSIDSSKLILVTYSIVYPVSVIFMIIGAVFLNVIL